jgi:hypothetical protein
MIAQSSLFAPSAAARLAAAATAIFLAATPATAQESRSTMAISAWVAPTCQVESPDAEAGARIACSEGTGYTTMTATQPDERPLSEAALILGEPVRQDDTIRFTAPVIPARSADGAAQTPIRYQTITY